MERWDKMILKRGKNATDYFEYCEEAGCDVWGLLCSIKEALYEPIGMWLPDTFRTPGTSFYAQGVEVPAGYSGVVPDGFDIITLPPCMMMVFFERGVFIERPHGFITKPHGGTLRNHRGKTNRLREE